MPAVEQQPALGGHAWSQVLSTAATGHTGWPMLGHGLGGLRSALARLSGRAVSLEPIDVELLLALHCWPWRRRAPAW